MIAYKGFHKNLTCTMGKGSFQYRPRIWYEESEANCGENGFHATDNPLDVLFYYNADDDRYFIVDVQGNIDEDGTNSRISAPKIKLIKELTKEQLYREGVIWMSLHPKAPWARIVERETGDAGGHGNIVVRGRGPKAKGKIGDWLYLIKEDSQGNITEIGAYKVDGENYLPNIFYDAKGDVVSGKKGARKAAHA